MRIAYLICFLSNLLFSPISFAAEKIVNIDFAGLARVEESEVRRHIHSLEGAPYSQPTISQDIKSLYKTGLFRDVTVERKQIPGGVLLVFHVQEKGTIESIAFKGNKKIKDDDLSGAATLRKHQFIDESRIAETKQAIRKLYEEKGYYLSDITHQIVPLDTEKGEVELVFNIKENAQTRIRRISFIGNKAFSDKKLAGIMKTKVKGTFSFVSGSGKFQDEKLEMDRRLLELFYKTEGFIKIKIGDPQMSVTRNKKGIYITIPLHEGHRYKVRKVGVGGDIITSQQELKAHFKLEEGKTFNQRLLEEDVVWLTEFYGDRAYAYAALFPDIVTDDEAKMADVTYEIEKGRSITIERIEIKGNKTTRDKVIRREMQIQENAPFNRSAIDLSRRRLMQLGYFEDVNIAYPRGSRDDTVNLVVRVKEKPTGSFNIGAGFSSLESFIFTATVQKDNFFGYGIRGSLSASLSKLRQEFSLSMTDRYFLDTRWIFSSSVYRFSSALNRDFDQRAFGGSASFGRELFPFFDVSMGYNIEDVLVSNFSAIVPQFFQQNSSGLTSSILTSVSLDTRDNRLFTTKGMYHAITSTYAGKGIGGDNDFWKLTAETRWFFKLPLKTILKLRGMMSYVNSLNDNPVPLFERFFLGGINTLRGFDLNSIGPQLRIPGSVTGGDQQFTYGGNRLLLFNMEYELPIYDPAGLRFVTFIDAGEAFAETESIDLTHIRSNYGFGLRWNSPFGPLRFEWGFPINRKSGESVTVFNFTIGQAF